MKEALQGPLINRYPNAAGVPELCRRNSDGSNYKVGGHTHPIDHVTYFWGRWRITVEVNILKDGVPVFDPVDGKPLTHVLETREIAGNGPDSFVLVRAEHIHSLELLDDTGFYLCSFGHLDEDGQPSRFYRGMIHTTR